MPTYNFDPINIGTAPNSKDGDTIRSAFRKVNKYFGVIFGSPSAILVNQSDDFTAASYTTYVVDTRTKVINMTLPAIPQQGDVINFVDGFGLFSTNNFRVNFSSNKLSGVVQPGGIKSYVTPFKFVSLMFVNSTIGWVEKTA